MDENTLALMITLQRQFMSVLGINGNDYFDRDNLMSSPDFISACIGVVSEGAEILNVLNTKSRPWKDALLRDEAKRELMEELIDIQFYVLELYNIMGMDSDLVLQQYVRKLSINMARVFKKVPIEKRREVFTLAYLNHFKWTPGKEIPGETRLEQAATVVITTILERRPFFQINDLIEDPVEYMKEMLKR